MRCRTLIALAVGAGAAAIYSTGFPRRIGLTRSQACISLPGDLELPRADVVADRAVLIDAPVETVWSVLDAAFEAEVEERVLVRQENDCLVLRVPAPGTVPDEGEEEDAHGVCTFALLPEANGKTRLHLRERHLSTEETPKALLWAGLTAEAWSSMSMLLDIKRIAQGA